MNGSRKSDSRIVPGKPSNKGCGVPRPAEGVEGRRPTKGNPGRQNRRRTQSRGSLQSALDRIRQAARRDRKQRFTSLWHHVCWSLADLRLRTGRRGTRGSPRPLPSWVSPTRVGGIEKGTSRS